jgi:hypothetical protein
MTVSPSAIQLWSGRFFDFHDMRPEDVSINDIAHALSMLCRFNGHVDKFYSVAQHSVLVSHHVQPEYALVGLMHDATEAYIGDMASPLKKQIPAFAEFEDKLWLIIAEKFNLPKELPDDVHQIDKKACLTEAHDLMGVGVDDWGWGIEPLYCPKIIPLMPELARMKFLDRFYELAARHAA